MAKNYLNLVLILLFGCLTILFPRIIFAENVGFSVKANIPKNQIDSTKSYFDLHVGENHEQNLDVTIFNQSDNDIIVRQEIFPATTNSQGVIVYEKNDDRLHDPITDFITIANDLVEIPAHSSKTVSAHLKTDETSCDGIKLGGLHFEKVEDADESKGLAISNNYAYVIGVQLTQKEQQVSQDIHLEKVYADLKDYLPAFLIELQNMAPIIIEDLRIKIDISHKGEIVPLKNSDQTINFAPNSYVDLAVYPDQYRLEPGIYDIDIKVSSKAKQWQWTETLNIKPSKTDYIYKDYAETSSDKPLLINWNEQFILLLIIITQLSQNQNNI